LCVVIQSTLVITISVIGRVDCSRYIAIETPSPNHIAIARVDCIVHLHLPHNRISYACRRVGTVVLLLIPGVRLQQAQSARFYDGKLGKAELSMTKMALVRLGHWPYLASLQLHVVVTRTNVP
jgi:hypothetical protein